MAREERTKRFPAISVRQPNADRIISGETRHDRRSRPTRFRGWILLHASRTYRARDFAEAGDAPELGKILGLVKLADCIADGEEWKYVWKSPRRFRAPIACPGHYSIPFYVPRKLVAASITAGLSPGKLEG